jgi:predicted esterase
MKALRAAEPYKTRSVLLSPGLREAGHPRGEAKLAGVLLHGRDRTKKEMTDLAAELDLDGVRWLAPAAEAGKWYPHRFFDERAENEPFLTRAVERCDKVMEEARENGRLKPDQIIVAGFSQGACLALEYAIRRPDHIGAVIVFTGALIGPPDTDWATLAPRGLNGLRVLITGSDADEWITERTTRETAHALVDLGADVRLRIYQGRKHVILPEEIEEARSFLTDLRALW